MDSMDCDLQLKRARDHDDLCDAFARKVICLDEDADSFWSQADDPPGSYFECGDPFDLEDPDDTPYRPTEYESDSDSDDSCSDARPLEVCADGDVPYVNSADWCVDVPDVLPEREWFENPGELRFDRFPDGMYRSRVLMTGAQVVECIRHPGRHYAALAAMAEDYVRSLLRFEPDRVHAAAVSRAFVDLAVRKLLDDPAASGLLKIESFDPLMRSNKDFAVSYRSWRRIETAYGFRP